jgi:hypothetical protein
LGRETVHCHGGYGDDGSVLENGSCLCLSDGGYGECWRVGEGIVSVSEIEGSLEPWWILRVHSGILCSIGGHGQEPEGKRGERKCGDKI